MKENCMKQKIFCAELCSSGNNLSFSTLPDTLHSSFNVCLGNRVEYCMRENVEGGGDGIKIWKVAANILNKQSQTADKE